MIEWVKWEYKVVARLPKQAEPSAQSMLGELGADGWELVQVAESGHHRLFFFKRPISLDEFGDWWHHPAASKYWNKAPRADAMSPQEILQTVDSV